MAVLESAGDTRQGRAAAAGTGAGRTGQPPTGSRIHLRRRLVAIDALAVACSWTAALVISSGVRWPGWSFVAWVAATSALTVGALATQRLYRARVANVRIDEVHRLGNASIASTAAALGCDVVLGRPHPGSLYVIGTLLVFTTLVMARGSFAGWLRRQRALGRHVQPVLVVGGGDEAEQLVRFLRDSPEIGFCPVGIVGYPRSGSTDVGVPWLGGLDGVADRVTRTGATGVMIASGSLRSRHLNQLVRHLHRTGVHVHVWSGLTGVHRRRMRIEPLAHEPLIYIEPHAFSSAQLAAKRTFDVVSASLLLVVLAPLVVTAAIAIRLGDRGPVFFRQVRVGREGEPFAIWKLRTMVVDAEERLDEVRPANLREGPLFKAAQDARVTRVGRLLRDTSIDEIPQLLNVLRGDMSMVGPRPALPTEVAQFDDDLLARLDVKPGVSGLWQVEAQDKPSFELYRRLDLFYVENWSLGLDVTILAATVTTVARRALRALRARNRQADEPWGTVLAPVEG